MFTDRKVRIKNLSHKIQSTQTIQLQSHKNATKQSFKRNPF